MGHGTVVPLSPPPCHKPVTNGPRKGRKAARELGFGNPTGGSLLFVANVCSDHRLSSSRITHNWCVCNYGHRPKRMALAKYGGGDCADQRGTPKLRLPPLEQVHNTNRK